MEIFSACQIEKDGRTLYIDNCGRKKDCTLIISSAARSNRLFECDIRACTPLTAKKLGIRKYISLNEGNRLFLGPFKIVPEKALGNEGAVNLLIDDNLYYFSSLPEIPGMLGPEITVLFPADLDTADETAAGIINYFKFAEPARFIISGKYSEGWAEILKTIAPCEIPASPLQSAFDFSTGV